MSRYQYGRRACGTAIRPSNDRRNDNIFNISNSSINLDRNRNCTTNTDDDVFKALCMFAKCSGLRTDTHDVTKSCVGCHRSAHQQSVDEFSDIEIDDAEPIFYNRTCMAQFFDKTLSMTAESTKRQRNENKRQFRTGKKREQQEESGEPSVLKRAEVEPSIALHQSPSA